MTSDAATKAFECGVCLRLLHQPTTLPCGHSFCRSCVTSCLERSRTCPECRGLVPINLPVPSCSTSLQTAVERLFPAESAARAAEELQSRQPESGGGSSGVDQLPLFVLDAMVPGQCMHLHVFEPRYLLLVRRALAHPSRQFGMVAPPSGPRHVLQPRSAWGPCASHGVIVVVEMVSELDGDRLLLEVRATRRFRVLRPYVHDDGYCCAERVEWVADTPVRSEEERLASLVLGRELRALVEQWVTEVERRGKERQLGQLRRILDRLGAAPPPSQPEALGLWAAAVLNPLPVLGLAPEVRPSCLSCVESNQRLKILLAALEVSLQHVTQPGVFQQLGAAARGGLHRLLLPLPRRTPWVNTLALFFVISSAAVGFCFGSELAAAAVGYCFGPEMQLAAKWLMIGADGNDALAARAGLFEM